MIKKLFILLFLALPLYGQVTYLERFTDYQYDAESWRLYNASVTCTNKVKLSDAYEALTTISAYYGSCAYWYSAKFEVLEESKENTDIEIQGKIWRISGSYYGHINSFKIYKDNDNYVQIGWGSTSALNLYLRIYENGSSTYSEYTANNSFSNDSARVIGVEYNASNKKVKFFYRANESSTKVYVGDTTKTISTFENYTLKAGYIPYTTVNAGTYLIDDISITYTPLTYIPPILDTLTFTSPSSYSYLTGGDSLEINWYSTRDSVSLVMLGDTVNVIGGSYKIGLSDSNFSFNIYGYQTNRPEINDIILGLQVKQSGKFIEIAEVDLPDLVVRTDSINVNMAIRSDMIDSFKVFYSFNDKDWRLINRWVVEDGEGVDNTNINFNLSLQGQYGALKFKAEEYRDTTTLIEPINYKRAGLSVVPDKRICYYILPDRNALDDKFWVAWERDLGCKWVSNITIDIGITTFAGVNINLSGQGWNFKKGLDVFYSVSANYFVKNISWSGKGSNKPDIFEPNVTIKNGEDIVGVISPNSNIYVSRGSTTYKGYRYYVNDKKIYVDDLVNKKIGILFCDLSDLYERTSQWVAPLFSGATSYAVSTGGYYHLIQNAYTEEGKQYISLTDYEYNIANPDSTYVPLMIVQSSGGWNEAIVVPLMDEPNDSSPLIYDEYEVEQPVKNVRNYFRGIHPKIWKWGNPEGVKP